MSVTRCIRDTNPRGFVFADTCAGMAVLVFESVAQQRLERCHRESFLPAEEFVSIWVPKEFFTDAAAPELSAEMAAVVADFHRHGFRLIAHALAETDSRELLSKIDGPTLLLWDDSDVRSPVDVVGAQLKNSIPSAELSSFPTPDMSATWSSPSSSTCRFVDSVRQSRMGVSKWA